MPDSVDAKQESEQLKKLSSFVKERPEAVFVLLVCPLLTSGIRLMANETR